MKKIIEHLGTTFIFSTHDQKVIDHADRLVKVEDGTIKAFGVRDAEYRWNLARVRNLSDIAAGETTE